MLLVSIHDVTPALSEHAGRLWDICLERGIRPALLIVPNWHGSWPLECHPQFVEWIRECAGAGAEIVLHGERHDEQGLSRSLRDHWRAWGQTDGEGEFLSLTEGVAIERIRRGIDRLAALGLEPVGFVPPAWLANAGTHRAAAAAGLTFTEDARFVYLLGSGQRLKSPVVRWSTRGAWRVRGSVAVAEARWLLQRTEEWPRIALHPRDLDHPATARSLQSSLDRWTQRHRPARYSDLTGALQPV
ncbi:MAG TPA: polysaccharide deacetylase family protein [Gemmatimonadales bacterium]